MSYVLTASSGSSIPTPVSIANGGTGADNASDGAKNLINTATGKDTLTTLDLFSTIPVAPPASPDPVDLEVSLQELIGALQAMGVIV